MQAKSKASAQKTIFYPESPEMQSVFGLIKEAVQIDGFTKQTPPDLKTIFLCMTPRSGSTYLGSALDANGVARFGELFRVVGGTMNRLKTKFKFDRYEDYVLSRVNRYTTNGVFGAKVGWTQFAHLYYLGAYDQFFKNSYFIYLTRKDMLSQAVSLYVASETGYFHTFDLATGAKTAKSDANEMQFDFDKFWKHLEKTVEKQAAWERFFAAEGVQPLRVFYEDVEADPQAVLKKISEFVEVPLPETLVLDTDYKKVGGDRYAAIKTRIAEEVAKRRRSLNIANL